MERLLGILGLFLVMNGLSNPGYGYQIKWQYLKVLLQADTLSIENLNKLGQDGWELAACPVDTFETGRTVYLDETSFPPYAYSRVNYCIFKKLVEIRELDASGPRIP